MRGFNTRKLQSLSTAKDFWKTLKIKKKMYATDSSKLRVDRTMILAPWTVVALRHNQRHFVTAHRCAGGLRSWTDVGLPRHLHFVWFFSVPVQAPTRANLFTVIPRNCPISVALYYPQRNFPGSQRRGQFNIFVTTAHRCAGDLEKKVDLRSHRQ